MSSEKQIAANRLNGVQGGVKTEGGKAVSRLNTRKHGIFAAALTDQDAQELHGIEDELVADLQPVGIVEEKLVEKLAVTYLRMQRCARAESDHYRQWRTSSLPFARKAREKRISFISPHDVRLTDQFLKLLHEPERRQQTRHSPSAPPLPPSAVPDPICVHPRSSAVAKMENEPNSASPVPPSVVPDPICIHRRSSSALPRLRDGAERGAVAKMENEPNLSQPELGAPVPTSVVSAGICACPPEADPSSAPERPALAGERVVVVDPQ